jgi:hypothetical protein
MVTTTARVKAVTVLEATETLNKALAYKSLLMANSPDSASVSYA